ACPPGKYGPNCNGVCRCLNPALCRDDTGYCEGFMCARGYRTPPYCNNTCLVNTYGVNCAEECHCPPGDTCTSINGLC
ncbi:hypothetical protein LOTGIDRAFT_59870, partial [Lottia gigantea]